MTRTLCTFAAAALLALGGAAVALAGFGTGASVHSVEGQQFSNTVATITSTATPNQRFVEQLYRDLLNRSADQTALDVWTTFLVQGGTRAQVAQNVLQSSEYRTNLVRSVYTTFLRRSASPTDVAAGVAFLSGATDEQFKAVVLGSDEYFQTQGGSTVDGFLNALFNDVLARTIDPTSLAQLSAQIAGGATRQQIAQLVLTSDEARADLVHAWFEQFLHRSPSTQDVQQFVALLAATTDENVIATIVGSDEYFADVPSSFVSATIDWGDGTPASDGTLIGGTVVAGTHTYGDEGVYTFTVTLHDLDGTFTVPGTATITDAPLTATPASFTVAKKNQFTNTVATFVDGNPGATPSDFTATIDWGDGSASNGTVTALAAGGFAVGGTHEYKKKGSYRVAVHVADVGGSTANATGTLTVGGQN